MVLAYPHKIKYVIASAEGRDNGRGAENISRTGHTAGRPLRSKGFSAEGNALRPKRIRWAVGQYPPDCHISVERYHNL
jgi:hypothetical protein